MSVMMPMGADARLSFRLPLLLLLWTLWLTLVFLGGDQLLAALFDFDAADRFAWLALWQQFDQGGALAFDFVVMTAAIWLVAPLGMLVLLMRLPEIAERTAFLQLYVPRLARSKSVSPISRKNTRLRRANPVAPFVRQDPQAEEAMSSSLSKEPASNDALPTRAAVASPPVVDVPVAVLSPAGSSASGSAEPVPPAPPANPGEKPLSGAPPELFVQPQAERDAADLAVTRALAIAEICTDPPEAWMRDALAEEVAVFTEETWHSLEAEEDGRLLLDRLAAMGLFAGQDRRTSVDAVFHEGLMLFEDAAPPVLPAESHAELLSLRAACLCNLVESHLSIAAWSASGDDDWRWLAPEIRDRLSAAMAAMQEDDWASLDRDPEMARRMRLLGDRLREELRGQAGGVRKAAPAIPSFISAVDPGGRAHQDSGASPIRDPAGLLLNAGYHVVAPPMAGGTNGYLLAQRPGKAILVRLFGLRGRQWCLSGDGLAPWEADGGRALPSPCRELWQRLLVMRSLHRDLHLCGLLVCHDGGFADPRSAAGLVAADQAKTTVSLVFLDEAPEGFADLRGWLAGAQG